jgi:hypothetical protein
MAYLWNYVYYDDTLVQPIWQKDYPPPPLQAQPYPPIVIDGDDKKAVYFCVVETVGSTWSPNYNLRIWKWDWKVGLLYPIDPFPLPREAGVNLVLTHRPMSFAESDGSHAFLVSSSGDFIDISPVIMTDGENPPNYLGRVDAFHMALEPTIGYAGGRTFACLTGSNLNVRVFSWDNTFTPFTLPSHRIPFQNTSDRQRRLIVFPRTQSGISRNAPPTIIKSDGTRQQTTGGIDLPSNMGTGYFYPALSPYPSGYDFFLWNFGGNWSWQQTNFDFRVMDWTDNETTWIFIKQATLQGVNIPPEMSLLIGDQRTVKHISAMNLGALICTQMKTFTYSYGYSTTSLQDALVLADLAVNKFYLCVLTPIGSEQSYYGNPPLITEAIISPPTFHVERGCWYATVLYLNNLPDGGYKIAFLQIIHPQFYSRFFASVPVIVSATPDDKFLTFIGRITARYPNQHWSLAIVATQDSNLKEIVASTKERVTRWEKWETSDDGTNWTELSEGNYIEGQKWVRLKVPKSIVEWKKDQFVARNQNKVWRFTFISEPAI